MMRSVQPEITFSVRVTTRPGEVVCMTGDGPVLGDWCPSKAVCMKRDNTFTEHEVWSVSVKSTNQTAFCYRYFTCLFMEADHEETERDLIITRWETSIYPRRFSAYERGEEQQVFGQCNGRISEDKGWLTGQTEIQIRLHSNPIHMWKSRYNQQKYSIKCTPLDLRYRDTATDAELIDEFDDDEDTLAVVSSKTLHPVEVSSLTSDHHVVSSVQGEFGVTYDNDSYVIYKTQTFEPEFMGFTLDFYVHRTSGINTGQLKHVGYAYVLPVNFKDTVGRKVVPISGLKHMPIGQISLEYLIVKPILGLPQSMRYCYARHWKHQRRPLDVGHRGMGSTYKAKELPANQENTIASLAEAGSHGADLVEFDVQLTKDLVPVIYHDFTVCLTMRKKSTPAEMGLYQVPVRDLTMDQLKQLKLSHSSHLDTHQQALAESSSEDKPDQQPFPTLRQAFELLDSHIGFNIEVKYAMLKRDGFYEDDQEHYTERNSYVDIIVKDVLQYAGSRRIIFSCFDPDVCIMLRRKQNKYPILFLTMANTQKYDHFEDKRTQCVDMAMRFAQSENLLGINVHTEELLANSECIRQCKEKGLVLFCWGEDNNDSENIQQLKQQGVDGVIYDRINDFKPTKDNVFKMESEAKLNLLKDVGKLNDDSDDSGVHAMGGKEHPLHPRKH